jgi:hypothetical protein
VIGIITIGAAYVIGLLVSIIVIRQILRRQVSPKAALPILKKIHLIAGTIAAAIGLLPAVYFSFLFGGNFGGAIGDYLGNPVGFSSLSVPIGIFTGIFVVFSIMLILCAYIGIGIAKIIIRYKKHEMT